MADAAWRRPFQNVATSEWLTKLSTGLVLVNVCLMCMPFYGMTSRYEDTLEAGQTFISWLFIAEMGIKLLGLGCVGYWEDGWNQLDGTIVSLSIFEMLMAAIGSGTGVKFTFLRMLRMLRVLRILRLMRSWKGLYLILSTFVRSIHHMSNVVFLILLAMFMFSLLGMQLFGGIYREETGYSSAACAGGACADGLEEKPHHHFDYCFPAMLTVFVLLTGEWIDALEPAAAILGPSVAIFFIFVVLLGKYLLLNLLVAVILHEFQEGDSKEGDLASARSGTSARSATSSNRDGVKLSPRTERSDLVSHRSSDDDGSARLSTAAVQARLRQPDDVDSDADDKALCLFHRTHPIRERCCWAIKQPWWDRIVIVAIIISSICLSLDSPRLDPQSQLARRLQGSDVFFTQLFFCEMGAKVVAMGFACNGKDSYMRSGWNQLDFVIVSVSCVLLLADAIPQLRPLRVLRVLRVLRPLRLISRNAGMKLIITSLFKAMPAVSNVLGVVFALQVVFAILGMQMFVGAMGSCTDPSILTEAECSAAAGGHPFASSAEATRWANPATGSFDNFGDAMRLLYVMSSGDQWERPMYSMMGMQGPGVAPIRNDLSPYALFSLAWMFCGYIFAINLFVGVVVDNFSRMQREHDGSATMTREQKQWASTMKSFASLLPTKATRPPAHPVRLRLYRLVHSTGFDAFITGVIVLNIGVMACNFWGIERQPEILGLYEHSMDVFSAIYYVEAAVKIAALGSDAYFRDSWCRFDFSLVCTSLLDQFASELLAAYLPIPPMLLRVMRILRILRILRLLKGAKQLRDLILTMVLSFPSLLNVASLLCLILFIYSVLGVSLFTFVALGDPVLDSHGGINVQRNFGTIGNAILVLLQCLTSDGWSTVMSDAMMEESSGRCSAAKGDCGTKAAIPFFISFQIVGTFILLNLVVAVILENFATLYFTSPDLVSPTDLELFSEAWAAFDPDATNYVPITVLPDLLMRVPRPLGVRGKTKETATRLCLRLTVPQHNGSVAYREVLQQLIENNYFKSGADLDEEAFKALPQSVVPPLTIPQVPPPQRPPGLDAGADDDDDDELTRAVAAQESIAEAFAMAKMFEDAPRDALIRSLARARTRIAIGDRSTCLIAKSRQQKKPDRTSMSSPTLLPQPRELPPPGTSFSAIELVGVGGYRVGHRPRVVCASGAVASGSPGVPTKKAGANKNDNDPANGLPHDSYAKCCGWTAVELVGFGIKPRSPVKVAKLGDGTSPGRGSPALRFFRSSSKAARSTPKCRGTPSPARDDGGTQRQLDFQGHVCEWTAIELVGLGAEGPVSRSKKKPGPWGKKCSASDKRKHERKPSRAPREHDPTEV